MAVAVWLCGLGMCVMQTPVLLGANSDQTRSIFPVAFIVGEACLAAAISVSLISAVREFKRKH